jgi:hypothetical protein
LEVENDTSNRDENEDDPEPNEQRWRAHVGCHTNPKDAENSADDTAQEGARPGLMLRTTFARLIGCPFGLDPHESSSFASHPPRFVCFLCLSYRSPFAVLYPFRS